MTYRVAGVVFFCLVSSSCAKVRDFGCLSDGYWIAAPSHAEFGVYDRQQTAVLERNVFEVGLVKGFIVARCEIREVASAPPQPDEKPCSDYGIVDTTTGQVRQGLSEAEARAVLERSGVAMPKLHYANEWFNQDWPDGNPSEFCRAKFPEAPVPQS